MKRYIFTIKTTPENKEEMIPVVAKNIQSAIAKLCQGDYYNEDQIRYIQIFK
jgi:hypothetical protein